jgi:creatinine amidohydrolase/Fe(II)-dependent formamide hydrolase-like protein
LDEPLKSAIVDRVRQCFPYFIGTRKRAEIPGDLRVVEFPTRELESVERPQVLAFSVDTAVEQHGPHLPLATDRIQSYSVLTRLAQDFDGMAIGPPLDYGQLTWGLPFGMSIDITAPLLARYVTRFTNALLDWLSPFSIYVVDVHGSTIHRAAIQEGLAASRCKRWAFRWLYEPLYEFAGGRGDQHAGGVETALVHFINPDLVDPGWWPNRVDELAAGQMPLEDVLDMSQDLGRFIQHVETCSRNGIVGDIRNFFTLNPTMLMEAMLSVARQDVVGLMK